MHTLTLHRRHRPACSAGHPVDSYSTEAEERRKNWKKCTCKIYAHGTLNGVFKKFATRARDWDGAAQAVAPFLAAGSWDVVDQPPPPAGPAPDGTGRNEMKNSPRETSGHAIGPAVENFLQNHQAARSAANTIRKYRQVLGQFVRFSDQLGLRSIEEWNRPYVRQLVTFWGESNDPLTVQKKLSVLKGFFEPLFEDHILTENPARIRNRAQNRAFRMREGTNSKQKSPFTDAELEQMLDGCRSLGRTEVREWPKKVSGRQVVAITEYRDYHRKWTGEDLADFIQISYFTGLRISDVATFDAARLQSTGEVKVRATKNGNWVCVWVPEWLQATIRRRAQIHGPLIFGAHSTTDTNVIADVWRRKLIALWVKSGPWKEKPTHHRFRHTFVRILLERGAPLQLIADLTGDTEQMIRRHYSAWMPGRQESANRFLAEAFRSVPRFHRS